MSFFALTFFLSTITFAQPMGKNFIDENFIEVTGKAETEIIPDEIYLRVIINEKDNKGKQSLEELERLMIGKLNALGLDLEESLTVIDIASNFKFYWLGKTDIFTSKEFQILVKDAATAGKIFRELESINISNIAIHRLDHSELEKHRGQVKAEAIKAAKAKAEKLVSAIDQNVGKALYIQELDDLSFEQVLRDNAAGMANIAIRGNAALYGNRSAEPQIAFDKIRLEYKILVRFKLN